MIEKNIVSSITSKNILEKEKVLMDSWESIRERHPNFKVSIFSNSEIEEIMDDEFPEYCKYFYSINEKMYVARSDFFSYLYLYKYGGFWFDIKTGLRDSFSLEDISENYDGMVVARKLAFKGRDSMGSIATQIWGFRKEHPILKEVVDLCISRIKSYDEKRFGISKHDQILYTTGPAIFRDTMWFRDLERENIKVFPQVSDKIIWSVFEPEITRFWNLKGVHREKTKSSICEKSGPLINKDLL